MRSLSLVTWRRLFAVAALACIAAPSTAGADTRVVTRGSTPWLFVGKHAVTTTTSRDVTTRARAALPASIAKLALETTGTHRFADGETIVTFEQTHLGLPVIGRGATARLRASGEVVMTAVDVEEDLPATATPKLAASFAASKASRFSVVGASADDAHLVVWPLRTGGSRLAWAVVPRVPTGLPFAPRVIVDAETGKVLEARDMVRFANARVYSFNPTKTPALIDDTLALTPTSTKLTHPFLGSSNCVDNKTVKAVNLFGFKTSMHVCDLVQSATANGAGDFLYEPADEPGSLASKSDPFSELQMYYHAGKAYAFFRGLQGSPDAQVVADKPLPVVANLQVPAGIQSGNFTAAANPDTPLETFSNAFFSPAGGGLGQLFNQLYGITSGALWFGQGAQRDYAYDGDVVYHEFTHAVVDHTLKLEQWHVDARGVVDAPGAMNEGLADYFSSAITGDPDVGEYASADLAPGMSVIRTLANDDKCPTTVYGEVHVDSTLFSGGLWQARTSLPEADRSKFDAALYKAMRTNPGRGDLGYDDLAKLFQATLATDLPSGATALEIAMTSRGVFPSCDRVYEYKEGGIKATGSPLGGFVAPGASVVQIGSDVVPGLLQVHVPVPQGTGMTKLVVSFTARKSRAGANPLGGESVPFTPVVLAKFGKPITWTVSAGKQGSHDADVIGEVDGLSGRVSATVALPEGATDAYFQITNKGDDDGAYDAIEASFLPADPEPRTNPEDVPPAATESTESDSGCSTHGRSPVGTTGLVLGAAVAFAAVRRRRR